MLIFTAVELNSTEQRKIKINFVFPLICTNFAAKI